VHDASEKFFLEWPHDGAHLFIIEPHEFGKVLVKKRNIVAMPHQRLN
jgi:hypothetical protein